MKLNAILSGVNTQTAFLIFITINLSLSNVCLCVENTFENSQSNDLMNENINSWTRSHRKRHQGHLIDHADQDIDSMLGKRQHQNFLLIDYLADGEMERRINYNGITAKETSISTTNKFLSLWQLSDGHRFIQMIYSSTDFDLIDCEYVDRPQFVNEFLKKFYDELESADRIRNFSSQRSSDANDISTEDDLATDAFGMRNLTYVTLRTSNDIPSELESLMDYDALKTQCDAKHKQLLKVIQDMKSKREEERSDASQHLSRRKRAITDFFIAPNTHWCGSGQTASKYTQLGGASKADKCCRRHDHCKFNIHAMTTRWHFFNFRPFTISHCSCDMRQRRDLSNLLRVPGTKWCGKGYTAKKYTEMGGFSKADRCCRQHDKSCPFWIMGFETKYGFFNWRINTLMHCKCDERFRTCLKAARSDDANFVGKLFFNVVQTQCFVLKPEKVCRKYSWWGGSCIRRGVRRRAHLRDNNKF